ncbi:MAG TPA: hypothetical protein VIM11_18960, partial [Tepidisphaeraceae bacterium]
MTIRPWARVFVLLLLLNDGRAWAEDSLSPEMRASIDKLVPQILAQTGAPSASLAIVKDGKIAYTHAYG